MFSLSKRGGEGERETKEREWKNESPPALMLSFTLQKKCCPGESKKEKTRLSFVSSDRGERKKIRGGKVFLFSLRFNLFIARGGKGRGEKKKTSLDIAFSTATKHITAAGKGGGRNR